jgi:hypothetical protein
MRTLMILPILRRKRRTMVSEEGAVDGTGAITMIEMLTEHPNRWLVEATH